MSSSQRSSNSFSNHWTDRSGLTTPSCPEGGLRILHCDSMCSAVWGGGLFLIWKNGRKIIMMPIIFDIEHTRSTVYTEAKRCFATHDEDESWLDECWKIVYIQSHAYIFKTVQLCSITSLWHSGQHLCRAIGRLQVRISQEFWLLSKRRSLWSWL